nr:hypothetical protein [Achromobacter ruhlandii]
MADPKKVINFTHHLIKRTLMKEMTWKLRHAPSEVRQSVLPETIGHYYEAALPGAKIALFDIARPQRSQLSDVGVRSAPTARHYLYIYEQGETLESARFSGQNLADLFEVVRQRAGDVDDLMDKLMGRM